MKPEWRAWLAVELEKGPSVHGWTEDWGWTLARVATVIARRFHERFGQAQSWSILRQMGFRCRYRCRCGGATDPTPASGTEHQPAASPGSVSLDGIVPG
ncbi:winged helix-turn-helix domain-containing protein [Streptomyces sp. NPDC001093]|uniref:winged helix-turn-helix domain-containing protein n=1 Tax=Streptomyces sp. NPDC001093 TaxID=3154376 RepID=UPI00331B5182